MKQIIKKSISIKGHSTSITMEPIFWEALKKISVENNKSLPQIIYEIDKKTSTVKTRNLSSAVRVYIFEYFYILR